VVIGPAGAGHDPTATFGQHTWAPRCYRLDGIGLISSSRAETAGSNQEARNPDTKWHRPSSIECDMLKSALAIAAFQPMRACKCAATASVKCRLGRFASMRAAAPQAVAAADLHYAARPYGPMAVIFFCSGVGHSAIP
jgi:hypothetical protein